METVTGTTAPLKEVHPNEDVWYIKYPLRQPLKAKVIRATRAEATLYAYDNNGTPNPDWPIRVKFRPKDHFLADVTCLFPDKASAIRYWNCLVDRSLAALKEKYEQSRTVTEGKRLPA